MLPKISIVTPSFNQASYINDTINSVLNQQYENLEYIVIDGNSTDGTKDVIKKYESVLSYSASEKDNGMYDALNKGFSKSTGEIMGWINSDDLYLPKALHVVAEIFSRFPDVQWITGASTLLDESGRIIQSTPPRRWSKYHFYLHDYKWIQQESVFWRRSLWEKAGSRVDSSLQYAGDFELWLRFFRFAKLYTVNAPLGCFRLRTREQKSIEHMNDYIKEVDALLGKEKLINKDTVVLNEIKRLQNLDKKPLLGRLASANRKYSALFDYPPQFRFDRATQLFKQY